MVRLTKFTVLMRLPYGPNALWSWRYARIGWSIVSVFRLLPFTRLYLVTVINV